METRSKPDRRWTEDAIFSGLREVAVDGTVSYRAAQRYSNSLPTMGARRFGSFDAACRAAGLRSKTAARPTYETCTVRGCNRAARGIWTEYCEPHYMRVRRHGSTESRSRKSIGILNHTGGYILLYRPKHPLRTGNPYVYQHRAVFYAAHGEGPFSCHWCGKALTWKKMDVDHLNDVKNDNRIENLVASCPRCNVERGRAKNTTAQRAMGVQMSFGGRTMCMSEWAAEIGITQQSLRYRIKAGWPISRALAEPRGTQGPRRSSK